MTQKQIISDLGLDQNYWLAKIYAGKISVLLSLINDLEKLPGFKVCLNGLKGNYEMVKSLPVLSELNYRTKHQFFEAEKQQDNCKQIYGEFEQWQQVTVIHAKGSYSFPFPMNNRLYNVIASMAGEIVPQKETAPVTVLNTITVDSGVLKTFSKAIKFISKDDLRPAMQHILLDFSEYVVEVVATDAHRLYLSPKFEASEKNGVKVLISEDVAKKLSKIKPDSDVIEISILEGDKIMVCGEIYPTFDARFPDYKVVIPEYEGAMVFDTKRLIENVKNVIPYANKVTTQVNFHLNGNILMSSQDVDFSFESKAQMNYVSKNFPDTDIAFNGKMLVDSLGIFKDKTIKMKTDGNSHKGGIFTNGLDTVLLMPLLINC